MRIEFGELRLGLVARDHLQDCLNRNWVSAGPKVAEFERSWGALFGYQHNKAVSSGTDACINMCLALRVLAPGRCQEGAEIIVPALSFIATAHAVRAAGFHPVFVDIDRHTLNIDHTKIEAAISPRTVGLLVVHTMGRPCEMGSIVEIASRRNLFLLEDCCEAHGAQYHGQYVGTFGVAAAFSFYIAHLVCCGEGGMVSTKFAQVAEAINSTRSHGRRGGQLYFDFPHFGLNSKMNDLEASVGLEGVVNFWETFATRHDHMLAMHHGLAAYKDLFWASEEDRSCLNCPHGYSLTTKGPNRSDGLKDALDKADIHWKRNFGSTPTQHGSFAYLGHQLGDFPEAEYVGEHGIHVGLHQYLSVADIERMVAALVDFFESCRERP